MSRQSLTWSGFVAALALVLCVMLFLTVKTLSFERSMAQAQANAVLEENVRLALWRMDSAAAVLLAQGNNLKTPPAPAQPSQYGVQQAQMRNAPEVQSVISQQEYQQRASLNLLQNDDVTGSSGWRRIAPVLLDRIADIFPGASLEPSSGDADPSTDPRRLASIPARLVLPASATSSVEIAWNTPLRVSLLVAWACMLLAAAAVASLLAATLSLSERRGAFASAVTHELRTPLTTIRMYGEMLSGGMVADEASRRQYLDTLVTEADRLGHMVENVLAYARLEKRLSPRKAETVTVRDLLERTLPPLRRRAAQAGLSLVLTVPEDVASVPCRTDPVAVGQILLNLVDNGCKFGQTDLRITASTTDGLVVLTISDDGPGCGTRQLFTPFGKSKADPVPGIGLGLYLSRQLARQTGGNLRHVSSARGASFALELPRAGG